MATQVDILETIFRITGGAQFAAALSQAANAAQVLSQGTMAAQGGTAALSGSLGQTIPLLGLVTLAITALTSTITLLTTSLKAFSDESKQLFQTGVVLKNLGSSLTLPEVRQFADRTSQATGISRPQIEGTAGVLARAGVQGGQIEETLKVIGDAARGTGKSFSEVGDAIERGILGHMRGLAQFGIVLQDTGSKAANLALIQQQLRLRFEGAAEAFRGTLPGAIEEFQAALGRFFSLIGEQWAPTAIAVLKDLTNAAEFFTGFIASQTEAMHFFSGFMSTLLGQSGAGQGDPMSKVGHGGDPASEATAREIADNTKLMSDAVTQGVLGGPGAIVNQSFGFMGARIAMAI
jgi:hypothetical protein